jgi:hypothetical protein
MQTFESIGMLVLACTAAALLTLDAFAVRTNFYLVATPTKFAQCTPSEHDGPRPL